MVDISRDPRWEEYLKVQEKILLGSQIAKAMVKGYQGDDLSLITLFFHVSNILLYMVHLKEDEIIILLTW
jgi:beta-glucosidase